MISMNIGLKWNEKIIQEDNKVLKRLFNLNTNAFAEGALEKKPKKLSGLPAIWC